ncbi:MAG: xanthine dehydrogenase family protein molybdopterin-binding subunit [Acetobacteraceae bacterium]|nr:xanthine dehydrogenase family protein molybdopterin-binding subunit [Acetobacteraceae bacterium]
MPDGSERPLRRVEDLRLLTGRGSYTADLSPPGLLHAVMLRSPHAHANIVSIDIAVARTLPGVIAIYTEADLEADNLPPLPGGVEIPGPDGKPGPKHGRPALARGRVRFVGEGVAMIVAETRAAGLEAAEAIAVVYAPRAAVTSAAAALGPGAALVWDDVADNTGFLWIRGDKPAVAAAMESAAHIARARIEISRVTANTMEPRVALGQVDPDGRLRITAAHQSPHQLRNALANNIFKVAPEDIRVTLGEVGGSFGMKSGLHVEVVLCGWAARKLNRPVLWVSDRTEGFLTDEQARDIVVDVALALDAAGNFLALDVHYDANIGAFLSGRSPSMVGNAGGLAGVYVLPAMAAEIRGVFSHTMPTAAYRGAGRPEATYVLERIIDIAARETGRDPFALRRQNLIPPEAMPYKTALTFTYDCGEFEGNMTLAAEIADLAGYAARRAESESRGKLRGIGLCNCIEVAGGPFVRPASDMAQLTLAEDGVLTLVSGSMSVGQGLETTMPQLVSERFGIPLEKIRYKFGDTDNLPSGKGNGGSGALCIGGAAVSIAMDALITKLQNIAAELLEAAPGDIELTNGKFCIAGTDRSVSLAQVARGALSPDELTETGKFTPTAVTFPNGTHVAEVEIDPETGVTKLVRYAAVEELGRILNMQVVAGQIHGGVVQGVGQALGEVILHDSETGQLLTASFMDYQMPRADEMPEFILATREVPTKVNPLGAKGVGEAGTVGALGAAMNAICDALAPLGISHFDMPATPGRVWEAIQAASGRRQGISG